jgi:hypothetical protein
VRVLVGCEFSGTVRDAFTYFGHYAVSCDLLPTESPGMHIQGDLLCAAKSYEWDILIAHPPCTYLTTACPGNWKDPSRLGKQAEAIVFVKEILGLPIPCIAVENPPGALSRIIGKPTQVIHPWQFGHGETKPTCLWLKGLKPLEPTVKMSGREHTLARLGETKDRWKLRSTTFAGIAVAMAKQWGGDCREESVA